MSAWAQVGGGEGRLTIKLMERFGVEVQHVDEFALALCMCMCLPPGQMRVRPDSRRPQGGGGKHDRTDVGGLAA